MMDGMYDNIGTGKQNAPHPLIKVNIGLTENNHKEVKQKYSYNEEKYI